MKLTQIKALAIALVVGAFTYSGNAVVVFSDDMSGTFGTNWTGTGLPGGDQGFVGDRMRIIAPGGTSGNGFATTATSGFGAPYNSTLNANTGVITWSFNMRQTTGNPGNFNLGNNAIGFVLGSTTSDLTSSNGYAVVLGSATTTDPVRLVHYAGSMQGDANHTTFLTASAPLDDIGNDFLSLQVTYNPTTDQWSLFGRNDGATAFADPLSGSLSSLGSATNSTYTGVALTHMGAYLSHDAGAFQRTGLFDNVTVDVTAVPEPSTIALVAGGLVALVVLKRRRKF